MNQYDQPSKWITVLSVVVLALAYLSRPIAAAIDLDPGVPFLTHILQATGTLITLLVIAWFATKNKSPAAQARGRMYAAAILLLGQLASIYNANQ